MQKWHTLYLRPDDLHPVEEPYTIAKALEDCESRYGAGSDAVVFLNSLTDAQLQLLHKCIKGQDTELNLLLPFFHKVAWVYYHRGE